MDYTSKAWDNDILEAADLAYGDEYTTANARKLNWQMRLVDQSYMYPIRGRFNATDRAIRRAQLFARENGVWDNAGSYVNFVDQEIGIIVNDPRSM